MITPKQTRRPVGGEITPRRSLRRRAGQTQRKPAIDQYAPSHNVKWIKRTAAAPQPRVQQATNLPPKAITVPPATEKPKAKTIAAEQTQTAHAPKPAAQKTPLRRKLWQSLQIPLILVGGLLLGVLAQSAVVGQALIILYGVIAYIRRVESRTTFTLATLTIVITIVLIVMQNNSALSQAFAGYTFLFLLIGVICAFRESHEEERLLTKKRGIFRLKQAKGTRT